MKGVPVWNADLDDPRLVAGVAKERLRTCCAASSADVITAELTKLKTLFLQTTTIPGANAGAG